MSEDTEFSKTDSSAGHTNGTSAEMTSSDPLAKEVQHNGVSMPEKGIVFPGQHGQNFMSVAQQNIFMIALTLTQLIQLIPFGVGINAARMIASQLGADESWAVWIAASYPLTQGSFVLIGGQLGAIYGHKFMFTIGCAWWTFWAVAGGLSNNLVAMCFMRGLCGIGGGIMVPNIVALLGITFPPGRRRNLSFGLFGAMAPVGAAGGSLIGGVVVQLTEFKWLFLLLGLLGLVVYGTAIVTVKADVPVAPNASMDWTGAGLGVSALILFNFAWNQAPLVGWSEPYVITLLIVSIILCALFSIWEARIAKDPILPFNIWKSSSFGTVILSIFFAFMSLGTFLWYATQYMQVIRGDSPIKTGVQFLPLTILGCGNAFLAAWLVPRLPTQIIIGIGCTALIAINVLLATVPANLTYWAMMFPALILSAFTADLIVTSAQIVVSNTVPRRYQGVAGSLVGTLLTYGMSTGLGFAGTVEVHTNHGGRDLLRGYHSACYLGVGFAGAALFLGCLIRIPKDTREGWNEDNENVD